MYVCIYEDVYIRACVSVHKSACISVFMCIPISMNMRECNVPHVCAYASV